MGAGPHPRLVILVIYQDLIATRRARDPRPCLVIGQISHSAKLAPTALHNAVSFARRWSPQSLDRWSAQRAASALFQAWNKVTGIHGTVPSRGLRALLLTGAHKAKAVAPHFMGRADAAQGNR